MRHPLYKGAPVTTVGIDFLFQQPAGPVIWPCWRYSKGPSMKSCVSRRAKLEALKKESELALRDQIRRSLARPPEHRTSFLRKRIAFRISCL
jgi:hypothetical protein